MSVECPRNDSVISYAQNFEDVVLERCFKTSRSQTIGVDPLPALTSKGCRHRWHCHPKAGTSRRRGVGRPRCSGSRPRGGSFHSGRSCRQQVGIVDFGRPGGPARMALVKGSSKGQTPMTRRTRRLHRHLARMGAHCCRVRLRLWVERRDQPLLRSKGELGPPRAPQDARQLLGPGGEVPHLGVEERAGRCSREDQVAGRGSRRGARGDQVS